MSLDLPTAAAEAEQNGGGFLRALQVPAIIDEVQYAPQLFRWLKLAIDADRNSMGNFLLTGSQRFELMRGVGESLAGRISIFELFTLSAMEIERAKGVILEGDRLFEFLLRGGYPELHVGDMDARRFYSDYIATYISRDVRQLINIKSGRDFDRFLRMLAARSGNLISMNSLAADLGLSPSTVRAWLSVLEASHIVTSIEPWFKNSTKRIIKTSKVFFNDTGLCCALLGITSVQQLMASPHLGALFETFVAGQILREASLRGRQRFVWFFRDQDGHEIDFVVENGGKTHLIECKTSENPRRDFKNFDFFQKHFAHSANVTRHFITPARTHRELLSEGIAFGSPVDFSGFFKD